MAIGNDLAAIVQGGMRSRTASLLDLTGRLSSR